MARDVAGADTAMLQEAFSNPGEEYYFTLQHGKNYLLKAEAEGYQPRYIPISTKNVTYSDTLIQDVGLKAIPPIEFEVPNVYFETNKANISKEQQAELKELAAFMNVNPKLKLRIVGNSDDVGSSKYNERLSERRANSVYKFMTSDAGIAKERFEVVGVGENQPAVNPKVDKVSEVVARELNRRVEFEVLDNPMFIIKKKTKK